MATRAAIEVVHNLKGSQLRVCLGEDIESGDLASDIDAGPVPTNYQRFAEAVRTGVTPEPSFRHAAELQKVLDLAVVADEKRAELRAQADTQ